MITCDEIIYVMDIVSTNLTNTILTNMANVSASSDVKKVRYNMDSYNLHTALLVIILLFIITIICYNYAKHR